MAFTTLIPGLKVEVKGVNDATSNRLVAKEIKYSGDDLKMAEAMQAGMVPTQKNVEANKQAVASNKSQIEANQQNIAANQQNIAANQQEIENVNRRFSDLTEYDTKDTENVYFASGSTKISEKDKEALARLAHEAVNLKGYLVQVKGFADSSGNAAMNQKLSMERAQEVVAYLLQTCNVPQRHIVAPGAMGEVNPESPNETAQGRAQNRRVEVKVLVNRAVAGM